MARAGVTACCYKSSERREIGELNDSFCRFLDRMLSLSLLSFPLLFEVCLMHEGKREVNGKSNELKTRLPYTAMVVLVIPWTIKNHLTWICIKSESCDIKNLQPDFVAMRWRVKSRQSQVAFAVVPPLDQTASSISQGFDSWWFFFLVLSRVVEGFMRVSRVW